MAALRVGNTVHLAFGARMGHLASRAVFHLENEIDINVDVHTDLEPSWGE